MALKNKLEKPKLEIKTRSPQKKGLFDNLGADRDSSVHPISEILNLNNLPSNDSIPFPKTNLKILDDQKTTSWTTKNTNLDDQHTNNGQPKLEHLDDQNFPSWTTNTKKLDNQTDTFGRPIQKHLDDKATKKQTWTTKKSTNLDDKATKNKILDDQKSVWAKYEENRSTDRIGLRPNKEILRQFKVFCAEKDLTLTEFFEIAGLKFIDLDDQMKNNLDDWTTINNKQLKTMWKTKPLIINLYYAYNKFFTSKVKWSAKDDKHGQNFNDFDLRIIELGIIQTQANLVSEGNTNTTINGFLYYTNEIKKFLMYEDNPEMLDAILKINRENWQKIFNKQIDLDFMKTEE
jgi:hypothetical protein